MTDYNIAFYWKDSTGRRKEKKGFEKIEDAVEYMYGMRRNPQVRELDYELLPTEKAKNKIVMV